MEQIAFPRYEQYKKAQSPWLQEVPIHWQLKPGFSVLIENKQKNIGMLENTVLSLSYGQIVIKPVEKLTGLVPESFETYQVIKPNDIIIRPTDLQNDYNSLRTGLSKNHGIITSAYICLRPNPEHNPAFLYYLLHAYDLMKVFYGMGSGLRQNLDYKDFKRLEICLPPRNEQDRIANFLDQKTAEIDEVIAKKQRLIDLLKEQRAILIDRAITKGINPNAPTRDSGVEWIGDIPEYWEIKKLKNLVRFSSGGTPSKNNPNYWNGDIPWVSPKDMKKKYLSDSQDHVTNLAVKRSHVKLVSVNSVLIVVRGMILARKIPVASPLVPVTINQDMKAMQPLRSIVSGYLLYLIDSIYREISLFIEESGHGTKTLPTEKLGNLVLPLPPIEDQLKIVEYVKKIEKNFCDSILINQKQIKQLNDFRQSIVAEAVTGKIKL
ncbi:restriction endonuclease subunit S [Allochromatium palmeri]|uniref:Restriction endonuclease subunit S n=1 Tax=Allochromatium palmeri TaxID=231048 RepID=A0A6N8EEE2_9GAMM|nr:restriction endonuclease subunit S [Allochromatium palmeri]MTW22605.1 restriction endonuclease subunit S [Allochromatium palmeri]